MRTAFSKFFNVRFSEELYVAAARLAAQRQQTIADFTRQVVLAECRREGLRVRPLRSISKQATKQTEAAAEAA